MDNLKCNQQNKLKCLYHTKLGNSILNCNTYVNWAKVMKCCMILHYVTHEITLWELGKPGFNAQKGQDFSLFQHWASYSKGTAGLVVKWPGHESDHQPPSSAEVKEWTLTLLSLGLHGMNRDNLVFLLKLHYKNIYKKKKRMASM